MSERVIAVHEERIELLEKEIAELKGQVSVRQKSGGEKEVEALNIEPGKICRINAGDCGINIEGPALIICIKEKDLVEPKPSKGQNV